MVDGVIEMTKQFSNRILMVLTLIASTLVGLAVAQTNQEYVKALATVYAGGATARLVKEWCDERAPQTQAQNARAFEAWRKRMELPKIDATLEALIGDGKARIDASLEEKRVEFYAQLDQQSSDPSTDCTGFEKSLNEEFNLKTLYAADYKVIAANANKNGSGSSGSGLGSGLLPKGSGSSNSGGAAASGTVGSSTGQSPSGANSSTTAPGSKLPALPPFDYAKFAKLGINPEVEPIPDEYRCHARIPGDQYATPSAILQMLPGRKYKFAFSGTIYEGTYTLERNQYLEFNRGLLTKQDPKNNKYDFDRKSGAFIGMRDLEIGNRKFDFQCPRRGFEEQRVLLRYKLRDPQLGSYKCVSSENENIGTLEVLPGRRYKAGNDEGEYTVDITGGDNSASTIEFLSGPLKGRSTNYSSNTSGLQRFSMYVRPTFECVRKAKALPEPAAFGSSKAPAAPGKGGLEGRYYWSEAQVPVGGFMACGGVCYSYRFFQKEGYVYTDDADEAAGVEAINCGRTYPTGFPVCEVYTLKGNTIQIGSEKPVRFERVGQSLELDGRPFYLIEPLDGIKLNKPYTSTEAGGTSAYGYISSADIDFRADGRFSNATANTTQTSGPNVTASTSNGGGSRGTYRLYGNTIEFKYDDGRVVKLFVFSTRGRKNLEYLRIGGRTYSLAK
jgi:hypothetical protein